MFILTILYFYSFTNTIKTSLKTISIYFQLHSLAVEIRRTPKRMAKFKAICKQIAREEGEEGGCDDVLPILDVPTRWSSTFEMIIRGLRIMKALTRMAALPENNMRDKELSEEDWKLLKLVSEFLNPFAQVTKVMEGSKYTTLSGVVPLFNKLLNHAEDWSVKPRISDLIRKGASSAFEKLNKYYQKVRCLLLYQIAS